MVEIGSSAIILLFKFTPPFNPPLTDKMNYHARKNCPETERIRANDAREANWKRWGPYLSERQWGTVREDYSANGDSWRSFTHEQAISRTYRWGEDGLLGITDRQNRLSFALALWNEKDPILKERLFGLTGPEGNHGEDVKEAYFYLDSAPSHSYMKALYKYPQAEFPYKQLRDENAKRSLQQLEYELQDAGVFRESRYFDVLAEYSKADPNDVLIQITISNRGPDEAPIHLLPTFWYRNTWGTGRKGEGYWAEPSITLDSPGHLVTDHDSLGRFHMLYEGADGDLTPPPALFTNNESNLKKLFNGVNSTPFVKDAFHRFVVNKESSAVNPEYQGTKAAPHFNFSIPAGESKVVRLRLISDEKYQTAVSEQRIPSGNVGVGMDFESVFAARLSETDEFYNNVLDDIDGEDAKQVSRQGYAGLLWSKQFYFYSVRDWLVGDPNGPTPPHQRKTGRNNEWAHLYNRDVISMPDKWEYPWYAVWDLAFHMVPFGRIDIEFAKQQLLLFLREWYMHPSGQIPAYEFSFSDANPPVHAWAAWEIYRMSGPEGQRDRSFLARVFHKLTINFTWWINRKDNDGNHIFSGGFLGLDNIGVFDRSRESPIGGRLDQADATAWMAFYCTTMLTIALELASEDESYEDVASKFFEHFVTIADAMNQLGGNGLWNEADGFYYDHLSRGNDTFALKIRSLVGLLPMVAVGVLDSDLIDRLPGFNKRLQWFLKNRKALSQHITFKKCDNQRSMMLLAMPSRQRLESILRYMLDESEFLSDYGIRSMSKTHEMHPFELKADGHSYSVKYNPQESDSYLFGGNSNWRGPIWFPVNYLIIESLHQYHDFYGDDFVIECPTGSGIYLNLKQVAQEIAARLTRLFLPDEKGHRPMNDFQERFANDPHWKDNLLFYEYFHGESGRGMGASHQTGWTALVITCFEEKHRAD